MSSSSSCATCSVQFTLFKRKNRCQVCRVPYCSQCIKKGESLPRRNVKQCLKCHALSSQPFIRSELMLLSVKELKSFLVQRNVSATGCTEKGDLVDVIINHQARPQVDAPPTREPPQASTQASAPSTSNQMQTESQPSTNTQNASQGMNNFFGLQFNPEIHRYVESMFNLDDSGFNGLRPPSRDELNNSQTQQTSFWSPGNQQHMPWNLEFAPTEHDVPIQSRPNRIPLESLKNANDIRKMPTKELKVLLDDNFVDYKGCVEKEELVQKAMMLWESKNFQQDTPGSENETQAGGENEVCKVCMDRVMDCVFLECGHLVTCVDCGRKLRECPMCRQNIVRIVRIFKS